MSKCQHDFTTNEDYSDFCSKGCGETFQNYNTKLRDSEIYKLQKENEILIHALDNVYLFGKCLVSRDYARAALEKIKQGGRA